MVRIFRLIRGGHWAKTGLPKNHPFCLFAKDVSNIERAQSLDDTVFWGALSLMMDAKDELVCMYTLRLRERRLPKCIDIRRAFDQQIPVIAGMNLQDRQSRDAQVRIRCKEALNKLAQFNNSRGPDNSHILVDEVRRTPYERFQDSKTPLNQILIRYGDNQVHDMAHLSDVVASAQTFEVCRAYHDQDDKDARSMIENLVGTSC